VIKNKIYFMALILIIASCDKYSTSQAEVSITKYKVGEISLFIPDAYTRTKSASVGRETGFLHTFYPGSNPIPGDPRELWENGEWYRNVNVVFTYQEIDRQKSVLDGFIKSKHASENAGVKYGLEHFTQRNEEQWFYDDIWIEDKDSGSFISCAEKQYDPANPQCTHYFYKDKFRFRITYNKKFLPDWKLIKINVLEMFESFNSRETATVYVQRLYNQNTIEED